VFTTGHFVFTAEHSLSACPIAKEYISMNCAGGILVEPGIGAGTKLLREPVVGQPWVFLAKEAYFKSIILRNPIILQILIQTKINQILPC
jgi:hypothetical protein